MNVAIWPGSSSFSTGSTPFGFYDTDTDFQSDADKVAKFCAQRLGYPITNVELQDINFYTAFEEALTTYGNEVYSYKVLQDYLSLEGMSTGSNLNHTLISPNMGTIIRLSDQYGTEIGVGGNTTWHTGSVALTSSVQNYDLNAWATENSLTGSDVEVKRVFYKSPPAITKYFDPYAGTGTGTMNMLDSFGWGNYSPGVNFLMMPLNFDVLKLQAIELNDTIRKSNYSFELINNQLRVFPIPNQTGSLYFEYILKSERIANSLVTSPSIVTNISNVPYTNPIYAQVNSVGRSWIFEYTLAISKEMLGYVRGKYSSIPIPNAEVNLNQGDLISAATAEKTALIERLRTYFDETSRMAALERRAQEGESKMQELQKVPYTIYIA
jgi:hypothetical protein